MGVKFALCIFSHCSKSIEKQIKKERSWVGWFVLNQCVVANLELQVFLPLHQRLMFRRLERRMQMGNQCRCLHS